MNPGSPAPQAGILDQARLRPLRVVQRPSEIEGKIVNTLIKLQSLGKGNNTIYYKLNFFLINNKDGASEKSKNNTSQYSQAIVPQTIRSVSQNSTSPQHRTHPKLNSSVVRHNVFHCQTHNRPKWLCSFNKGFLSDEQNSTRRQHRSLKTSVVTHKILAVPHITGLKQRERRGCFV